MVAARGVPHARDVTSTTEDPSCQFRGADAVPVLEDRHVRLKPVDAGDLARRDNYFRSFP
jgi:hypothetical protein